MKYDDLFTIEDTCPVCEKQFMTDGYLWTCQDCRFPSELCKCGSDDVSLDWTICDMNGEILPDAVWIVQCHMCDETTSQYNAPKEALYAWKNGERMKG